MSAESDTSQARSGPSVAAVGGGHGLSMTLRAVRDYAHHITAIVSTADDGGSTGRLRAEVDRPAPGDLRKCLVALASEDSLLSRAMEYRFGGGDLEGHAFGNLMLVALAESCGDLIEALDTVGELVGTVGRVLPATTVPVQLHARSHSGELVRGQVAVSACADISTVEVTPDNAPAADEAVAAIYDADQIVLGPGSLYTSVLATTSVQGIRDALIESTGQLVYVCNLAPQLAETASYEVADHVAALYRHGLSPDVVLYDPDAIGPFDQSLLVEAAPAPSAEFVEVAASLATSSGRAHDPKLLSIALKNLLD